MTFTRDNSKLQPKTEQFLGSLLGHMTLKFTDAVLDESMPDIEVNVNGEMRPFKGLHHRADYKILFCNKNTIVWSRKRPFDSVEEATTFNFVDDDTFWIYLGSTEPKIPDVHAREYFKRLH